MNMDVVSIDIVRKGIKKVWDNPNPPSFDNFKNLHNVVIEDLFATLPKKCSTQLLDSAKEGLEWGKYKSPRSRGVERNPAAKLLLWHSADNDKANAIEHHLESRWNRSIDWVSILRLFYPI